MSLKPKFAVLCACGMIVAAPAWAVDLVGVYKLALKNDPRLQAAEYRREATGENKSIARANLLPQLSGSGSWAKGTSKTSVPGYDIPNSDIDTTNYQASLQQSLYRRSNYEALDVARGQISQADADYQSAYEDFLLRVAQSYFTVLTRMDSVTFAQAEEKALQRQYEQAEQRFEVGLTAVTDVHEARAGYDSARANTIVARNDLADAKEALRELTGQYFEDFDKLKEVLPLVKPDPGNADRWVEIALQSNPAVLSSRAAVDVAESNLRLARAGHFPTLDLTASYSRFTNNKYVYRDFINNRELNTNLQIDDSQIGLSLNIPIFQGGRVNAQTRQAGYLLNAASSDLDDVQRGVVRQTQNAYRAVLAGIQEVEAFDQAKISAESALEATQAGFEVGTRTIVDVLLAQQRKYQAQRDNSQARHTYIIRHLQLKSDAGQLKAEDLETVNKLLE